MEPNYPFNPGDVVVLKSAPTVQMTVNECIDIGQIGTNGEKVYGVNVTLFDTKSRKPVTKGFKHFLLRRSEHPHDSFDTAEKAIAVLQDQMKKLRKDPYGRGLSADLINETANYLKEFLGEVQQHNFLMIRYKSYQGIMTEYDVLEERKIEMINFLEGSIAIIQEQGIPTKSPAPIMLKYIDLTRIQELELIKSTSFDLTKLIQLCKELNAAYSYEILLGTAMLARALVDHIPPIFGFKSFTEVANNYTQGTSSFKKSMIHLDSSLRNIADSHLHTHIRKKEATINRTQVNFSQDLDFLLSEIVRVLK